MLQPGEGNVGDRFCGPRCVQFILKYYGIDDDLVDLIKEIQWPSLEAGASMAALEQALRRREIHTCALEVSSNAVLKWPFPILVHLKPKMAGTGNIGHFVVMLPSDGETVDLWSGLSGIHRGTIAEFAKIRSGIVVLTSPQKVTSPGDAISNRFRWTTLVGSLFLLATLWGLKRVLFLISSRRPITTTGGIRENDINN